jgi:ribosomal-protein-alanine N-acetyltransferase
LVEQRIRNAKVGSSTLFSGTNTETALSGAVFFWAEASIMSSDLFPESGLTTPRLRVVRLLPEHAAALRAYKLAERERLQPWEPLRDDAWFEPQAVLERLTALQATMSRGEALHLIALARSTGELVAECNFSNIVRGPFQACHLGFSVAATWEGQGVMSEVLRAGIDFAFGSLGLHRVMANHRPENTRSARLLSKLGFEKEGYARAYLQINGAWADHVLMSLVSDGERSEAKNRT